ncbi:YceI family protein [Jannaschia sp. W003]|nr:YceI family protein [Jannaschia sp. W003]
MRSLLLAATLAAPAAAEPERYALAPDHSQILFQFEHLGYSTTWGLLSNLAGTIVFDPDDPAASSVEVAIPLAAMFTGWEPRDEAFRSAEFLGADENPEATFRSTAIEVTGEDTGRIAGVLALNGVEREVVLEARLNHRGDHPMERVPWIGFDATATLRRSDFDAGRFAPFISDEIEVRISVEARRAD